MRSSPVFWCCRGIGPVVWVLCLLTAFRAVAGAEAPPATQPAATPTDLIAQLSDHVLAILADKFAFIKNLFVFYDNGREVGLWCEDRRTTQGVGRVLGREDSEMARYWYRDVLRKWADAERKRQAAGTQSPAGSPGALR